jgi:hypothetical protein
MIFLSFPYTHTDKSVEIKRYQLAEEIAASIICAGHMIVSPVIHWHNAISKYSIPTEFDFWEKYCFEMIKMCNMIVVLKFPNWEGSIGTQGEIKYAKYLGINIIYIDPLEDINVILNNLKKNN